MSTAFRGTVLAGRYRLEERLQSNTDGALWRAVDSTLDRRVSVRVMRPGHPFAADVADAARRVALIDDDRLVRVLDVGNDGEIGFVVNEDVEGDTLAALVERSPLAPPVVRRIVGEVAQGLETAAARGLHHLCLTPRSVIVCRDGSVKIAGTAVDAAASGLEPAHAATANRTDATALVGLLYSGLTGRWPLGNAGFPPAPRGEGGVPVPPADLVRGIPNDLDTLCVVTLGGSDDGPRSPAELARELAPWPTAQEAPLRAAPRRIPSDAPTAPLPANSPLKIRSRPVAKRVPGATPTPIRPAGPAGKGTGNGPASGTSKSPAKDPAADAGKNTGQDAARGTAARAGEPAAGSADPRPSKQPRRSATMFPSSVALTGSLPIPKEPDVGRPRRMDSLFSSPPPKPDSAPASTEKTTPDKRTTAPIAKSGSTIRATPAAKPASPPTTAGRSNTAPTANGNKSAEEPFLPWSPGWSKPSSPASGTDANSPFPIVIPAETPPREQSRLVIFSITVVLALVLLVAAFSLRDLGSSDTGSSRQPSGISTSLPTGEASAIAPTDAAPTAEPSAAPTDPTPTETTTVASVPVTIAAIRAIDPQGDGDEDTASSPLAVDGDKSTAWSSQIYRSTTFSGLKKGVGLALKVKRSAPVSSATVEVGGAGGVVEVRTGSSPDLATSTLIGRALVENGRATVNVKDPKPAKYVILWFTRLPSLDGSYQLEVSEVRLK